MLYYGNSEMHCSIKPEKLELTPVIGRDGFYYVDTTFYVSVFMRNMWVQIIIPRGFVTDLMSGPKRLKERLGIKRMDHAIESIVHDYLYAHRLVHITDIHTFKCSRKEADLAMCNLMKFFDDAEIFVIDNVYDFLRGWAWPAWYMHRIKGLFRIEGHSL